MTTAEVNYGLKLFRRERGCQVVLVRHMSVVEIGSLDVCLLGCYAMSCEAELGRVSAEFE